MTDEAEAPVVDMSVLAPDDMVAVDADWSKGALVLAAGTIPSGETRPVVVVETRDDGGKLVERKYPTKGAIYFRYPAGAPTEAEPDPKRAEFNVDAAKPLYTMGENVQQGGFHGLSPTRGLVSVGPASPAYAGMNLAALEGATDIEVKGLTDAQKAQLQPWVAALPDLTITLT